MINANTGGRRGQSPLPVPHTALLFSAVKPGVLDIATMVTRHAITLDENVPAIGPGQLLASEDVHELLLTMARHDEGGAAPATGSGRLLTPDILSISGRFAAWYVPSAQRSMWFRRGNDTTKLTVAWPHLVIATAPRMVAVCAVAKPVTTGQDVPVFHAPLMNVYRSGKVCYNQRNELLGGLAGRAAAEHAVFATAFSHVNHARTFAGGKSAGVDTEQHFRRWKAREGKKTPPPASMLVPMDMTLSRWLESL